MRQLELFQDSSQSMARFRTASVAISRATISQTFTTTATTPARYRTRPGIPWRRTTPTTIARQLSSHSSTSTTKFMSASSRIWCKRPKLVTNDHRAVIPSREASIWVSLSFRAVIQLSFNVLWLQPALNLCCHQRVRFHNWNPLTQIGRECRHRQDHRMVRNLLSFWLSVCW